MPSKMPVRSVMPTDALQPRAPNTPGNANAKWTACPRAAAVSSCADDLQRLKRARATPRATLDVSEDVSKAQPVATASAHPSKPMPVTSQGDDSAFDNWDGGSCLKAEGQRGGARSPIPEAPTSNSSSPRSTHRLRVDIVREIQAGSTAVLPTSRVAVEDWLLALHSRAGSSGGSPLRRAAATTCDL